MNPQCEEIKINSKHCLLSGRGVGGGNGLEDLGYGGVDPNDPDNPLDPASREFDDLDEEEF